jgi:hypothetical protein
MFNLYLMKYYLSIILARNRKYRKYNIITYNNVIEESTNRKYCTIELELSQSISN